jgi:hypothetical protein
MTIDERLDGIEHVTAAIDEARCKEREEDRQLWRDTQRQINETNAAIAALATETRAAIAHTNATIERETERAREAEQQLRDRLASMVSAIGEFIARLPPPPAA